MFDIISKREFFRWWDQGLVDKSTWTLKSIQDAWAYSELRGSKGLRICEVGGGIPRVLPKLAAANECWNIDKLEGLGNGPTEESKVGGIHRLDAYLGDFDPRLADESFDVVFSLSVLEHVPDDRYLDCFRDMARILKPGGVMLHAIDLYIRETPREMPRVELYRHGAERSGSGVSLRSTPALPERVGFRCTYACNSDHQFASWNHVAPALRDTRESAMSCSIKAAWVKPGR